MRPEKRFDFIEFKANRRDQMSVRGAARAAVGYLLVGAVAGLAANALAADEEAARTLARQNNCFKCHAVDKKKEAPAWRDVAAKYKGKPDAEAKLIHHVTSGEKVKFEDGHEEDHKIIKTTDQAAIKNLVDWILSL
jgi:cytochrome c